MTDGYFYVSGKQPIHLVHALEAYVLSRGDDVSLFIGFKSKDGFTNPCSSREEESCKIYTQFLEKDTEGNEIIFSSTHFNINFGERVSISTGDKVPRTISGEKAIFRVTITKKNAEYFRLDIPLVVW
ncbi:MAG: hypothetical protein AAB522_03080 [Patescibacteria group bacterium]